MRESQRNIIRGLEDLSFRYKEAWLQEMYRKQFELEERGIKTNVLYDRIEAVREQHLKNNITDVSCYDALEQLRDFERGIPQND